MESCDSLFFPILMYINRVEHEKNKKNKKINLAKKGAGIDFVQRELIELIEFAFDAISYE